MTRTLEAVLDVDASGGLHLALTEALPPGHHHVLLVIDAGAAKNGQPKRSPLPGIIVDGGGWPEGFRVSRSELYDDD